MIRYGLPVARNTELLASYTNHDPVWQGLVELWQVTARQAQTETVPVRTTPFRNQNPHQSETTPLLAPDDI